MGLDSVADKEGDAKEKALLDVMLAQFRDENPGDPEVAIQQTGRMKT